MNVFVTPPWQNSPLWRPSRRSYLPALATGVSLGLGLHGGGGHVCWGDSGLKPRGDTYAGGRGYQTRLHQLFQYITRSLVK